MTATALICSDLDRTLIYSRRFLDPQSGPAECVETLDGEPISFMTAAAINALERLASQQVVVPATTRTVAQYQRIALPGGPYRFAVTSNGGTILVDGQPDPVWGASVTAAVAAGGIALEEILAALRARISDTWVRSVKTAEGLFCYLVVDEAAMPADFVSTWQAWCAPQGWKVSRQGRKIYTVPRSLCKSHAVDEVRRRLTATGELAADAAMLAAGDGALDAELLLAADTAIRPAHGELHAIGWQSDGLTITAARGAKAAEEILAWFHARSTTQNAQAL
ncbi:HAD family hydrolase [Mycolicibacterium fortuitum]